MEKVRIKKYSEAFKKQVVREYEAGSSAYQLKQKYGITGGDTIARWIKQYGLYGSRTEVMVIQKPQEQKRVKELEKKVAQLEKALAQMTLDKLMYEAMVEIAEEEYALDLKKNIAPQ